MSQLRSVTCHMGSHSVTYHPTQVNTPRLNPSHTGRYSIYLPWGDGRSGLVDQANVLTITPRRHLHWYNWLFWQECQIVRHSAYHAALPTPRLLFSVIPGTMAVKKYLTSFTKPVGLFQLTGC